MPAVTGGPTAVPARPRSVCGQPGGSAVWYGCGARSARVANRPAMLTLAMSTSVAQQRRCLPAGAWCVVRSPRPRLASCSPSLQLASRPAAPAGGQVLDRRRGPSRICPIVVSPYFRFAYMSRTDLRTLCRVRSWLPQLPAMWRRWPAVLLTRPHVRERRRPRYRWAATRRRSACPGNPAPRPALNRRQRRHRCRRSHTPFRSVARSWPGVGWWPEQKSLYCPRVGRVGCAG